MSPRSDHTRTLGLLLAALGILVARLVAPSLAEQTRVLCTLVGQLLAITGLVVVALAVRRRILRDTDPASSSD